MAPDNDAPPDVKKTAPGPSTDGRPSGSIGRLRRGVLVAAGILCVGLGLLGVVVPVLPTTPFLLLAAACFLRGSERLYRWLVGHRIFGNHLRRYRDGEGLPLSSKVATIALLWGTLAASAFLAVPARLWWVRLILLAVGVGVTVHLLGLKTRRRDAQKKIDASRPSWMTVGLTTDRCERERTKS